MMEAIPKEYESLYGVLMEALHQASYGKGKTRHSSPNELFENQVICEVTRRVGLGYPLGQAIKKIIESQRLDTPAGIQEILGAINYLCAAVIIMKEQDKGLDKETKEQINLWIENYKNDCIFIQEEGVDA